MDVAFNGSEEQTTINVTTINLTADITNIFLNPHLVTVSQVRTILTIFKVLFRKISNFQEQFWSDGVVLSAISCFGILSNLYLISRLAIKCTTRDVEHNFMNESNQNVILTKFLLGFLNFVSNISSSENRLMALLAVTDLLVLVLLGITRVPLVFAGPAWTLQLAPSLIFHLSPLEKGILTFSSFMFLIFAGERFLQTVSY